MWSFRLVELASIGTAIENDIKAAAKERIIESSIKGSGKLPEPNEETGRANDKIANLLDTSRRLYEKTKSFTPIELVNIGRSFERDIQAETQERMKAGKEPSGNLPEGTAGSMISNTMGQSQNTLSSAILQNNGSKEIPVYLFSEPALPIPQPG